MGPFVRHLSLVFAVLIGFAAISAEAASASPSSPRGSAPSAAVQTITASDLTSVINLDGPWRFHGGDDPHFADPNFDDSAWPAIRSSQPFKTIGVPAVTGTYIWTRIHLRIPQAAGPLALALYCPQGDQYEIFANGSRIGASPGMASRTRFLNPAFPVALPQSSEVVLAIRFYYPFTDYFGFPVLAFPRLSLGSFDTVRTMTELDRLRAFNNGPLANWVVSFVYLLVGLTAILLYRAQSDHDEYLWLGISALLFTLYLILIAALDSGWLPLTRTVILPCDYAGYLNMAATIEFVVRFTRMSRRWPIRIVQGAMLVPPLLQVLSNPNIYGYAFLMGLALNLAAIAACLISAYRRGMAETSLLLIPTVAGVSLGLAWGAALAFPTVVPWGPVFHFGPIGIYVNVLGSILYALGIVAIVLYRFIRVARDEAHAAAELEAARTVQQILIPDRTDTLPGFSVESVYQPAQQVGGDFFQVLPASDGGMLLVLGDVAGKGLPAAMLVAVLVGAVRSLVRFTHDPALILEELNDHLVGRAGEGFSTCLAAHIDPAGKVTLANAGHLPPYLDGREIDLPGALPLGIAAGVRYETCSFDLHPGNRLTFYSDGVVEAQNAAGELFGFERSREVSIRPAAEIAETARAFGQEDDITVVAIARAVIADPVPA